MDPQQGFQSIERLIQLEEVFSIYRPTVLIGENLCTGCAEILYRILCFFGSFLQIVQRKGCHKSGKAFRIFFTQITEALVGKPCKLCRMFRSDKLLHVGADNTRDLAVAVKFLHLLQPVTDVAHGRHFTCTVHHMCIAPQGNNAVIEFRGQVMIKHINALRHIQQVSFRLTDLDRLCYHYMDSHAERNSIV